MKQYVRWLISASFVLVGIAHFVMPDLFVAIIPPQLPLREEANLLAGLFEILGGVGLLIPRVRRIAGYGLILLLVVVYPANIYMALNPDGLGEPFTDIPVWSLYARLPVQFVLMGAIYWVIREPNGEMRKTL